MYVHREEYFNKQIKHSKMGRIMIRKWRLEQGIVEVALRKKKHKKKELYKYTREIKTVRQYTRKERINIEIFLYFYLVWLVIFRGFFILIPFYSFPFSLFCNQTRQEHEQNLMRLHTSIFVEGEKVYFLHRFFIWLFQLGNMSYKDQIYF